MIKKLFNGAATSITSAAVIVGVLSLASRLLGMLRDRALAGQFGAGQELDIYYAAFRIPDLTYNIIVFGALSAGFIPVFTRVLEGEGEEAAWRLTNRVLNVIMISLSIVCAALYFAAPRLTASLTPGFSSEATTAVTELTRIMLISPFLLGVSGIFSGALQAHKRFFAFSMASIMYNIGIIFGAVALAPTWGIHGVAWGVIIGAALHLLIQLPPSYALGYRYRAELNVHDESVRVIGKLMIPRTLTLAMSQITLFAVTMIATGMASGSLAVFTLANNLQMLPVGLFGISFAVAAFPTLSSLALRAEKSDFARRFSDTARHILFFMIPASVVLFVLRAQIVRVILGTGAFSWDDTRRTVDALALFAIGLFAQALIPLLIRGFYSLHDTMTPLISATLGMALTIYLSIAWTTPFSFLGYDFNMGVGGVALAWSVAAIAQTVMLWIALQYKTGTIGDRSFVLSITKIIVASVAMGVATQLVKQGVAQYMHIDTFMGIFVQGAVAGFVGVAVFITVGIVLRSQELYTIAHSIQHKLFRHKELFPKPIDESMTE